ncbi:hypothetical protein MANES_10G096051v8 [Manihot esculenta]|uniref:Uncharacterized protein n=1 Tax=Manihot esculenta TaxID=3983 RepID=A0ACC8D2P9_MANES|nr:hypothetical protein MANES_10G096051v8 [Manihot esculenta]
MKIRVCLIAKDDLLVCISRMQMQPLSRFQAVTLANFTACNYFWSFFMSGYQKNHS